MVRMPEDMPTHQYKDKAEEDREIDREIENAYSNPEDNFYGKISKLSVKYGTSRVQERLNLRKQKDAATNDGE